MNPKHTEVESEIIQATSEASANPGSQAPDFTILNVGDVFNGRTIKRIILQSDTCIVFLDLEANVNWQTGDEYGAFADDFGAVRSRAGSLESIPNDLLAPSQREALQRMIGEALAGVLDDKASDNANSILAQAEIFVKARTTERARRWYLSSAFAVCAIAVLLALALLGMREPVQQRIGLAGFEVILATLMGALGAVLSMILRVSKLDIDAMAGSGIHYFEGAVRTTAGMAGAFLVALCVKGNILLGIINATDQTIPFLLAIGVVAGASERLVPNIIKKVEGTLIVESPDKK